MCMEAKAWYQLFSSAALHFIYGGWISVVPSNLPLSPLPDCWGHIFMWVLENQTLVLMSAQKAFYPLSHLPSDNWIVP